MKRYEELGVLGHLHPEERTFRYLFDCIQVGLDARGMYGTAHVCDEGGRNSTVCAMYNILLLEHLEVDHPYPAPRDLMLSGVEVAVDLFFGTWRNCYLLGGEMHDEDGCRQVVTWLDPMRKSILLALVIDRQDLVQKLASYLNNEVGLEDPVEECYYMMLLTELLQGQRSEDHQVLISSIEKGRRKMPKLLLDAALAWERRDGNGFRKALISSLKHFVNKEFEPTNFVHSASPDVSILWNVACLTNLQFASLPEELMDFVITDKSFQETTT